MAPPSQGSGGGRVPRRPKQERLQRPQATTHISEDDWDFFLLEWSWYKKNMVLNDEEATDALMESMSEELQLMTSTADVITDAPDEQALLKGI